MRISTQIIQSNGVNAILDQQSSLSKTQIQLASGERVLKPSDDPTASALTIELTQNRELHEQYQRNINAGTARLRLEEDILTSVGNALQRARELAVQANGGALGPSDLNSIADEVQGILDSILGFANTKDSNGDYLFSGTKGATQAVVDAGGGVYNFQGDQNQRLLQIGASRTIADSDSGFDVFMDLVDNTGTPQSMFQMLNTFVTDLQAGTPNSNTITDMDNSLDKIIEVRSRIGARENAIEGQKIANDSVLLRLQELNSELNDLDYAEAIGRFNIELAGLQAAQQAYTKVQGLSLFNFIS